MFILDGVSCGNINVPEQIAGIISTVIFLIKVAVPILLVIFGMLDLGKAVIQQKEDEIKKQQTLFLKRLLAAALVFFVVVIAQFVVGIANGGNNDNTFWTCANSLINGD